MVLITSEINEEYRSREYLTIEATVSRGRHRQRDYSVFVGVPPRLERGEACRLKWDAIMFERRIIYINLLKGSLSGNHPLQTDEVEALPGIKATAVSRVLSGVESANSLLFTCENNISREFCNLS